MDHTYISLRAGEDRKTAVQVIERNDSHILPIVSEEGVLVGVVTVNDVLVLLAQTQS